MTDLDDHADNTRFACVGCGACCKGRFVPLTLAESAQWLRRGHSVAILIEAFDESAWPPGAPEFDYNILRSASVKCGEGSLNVVVILAANVIPRCPNLGDDDLCSIYLERPLVCRIYPMEINPFITLSPATKDCPPESWERGNLLASDRELTNQILRSRQADRHDAQLKVNLCEALGMTVAAWKGNGLAIYMPTVKDMLSAIDSLGSQDRDQQLWRITGQNIELLAVIKGRSLAVEEPSSTAYFFHQL